MDLEDVWPPFSLRIRCGHMELSPVRESDYSELADIAAGGVRRNNIPAFLVNWDSGTPEEIARSIAQYQWGTRANLRVDDWTMKYTVRVNGRAVGVQGVSATDFVRTRRSLTGRGWRCMSRARDMEPRCAELRWWRLLMTSMPESSTLAHSRGQRSQSQSLQRNWGTRPMESRRWSRTGWTGAR